LRRRVADVEASGGTAVPLACDVRDEASVATMAQAVAGLGPVHTVVANAGVAGPTAPLHEIVLTGWRDCLRTDLDGVFLTFRAFVPDLIAAGAGSLIAISSMTGKRPLHGRTPRVHRGVTAGPARRGGGGGRGVRLSRLRWGRIDHGRGPERHRGRRHVLATSIRGAKMQLIDLSQDIYEGMKVYPGHLKTVQFDHAIHEETAPRFDSGFSFQTTGFMLNDNGPTHVDSFSHLDPDPSAETIDKMALELFYGTAVCLT
jgi:hypothetical protein